MGGDLVGIGVVRRVLHRAEVPDFVFLWNDHQTAGVLARGAAHAHAAGGKPGFLGTGRGSAPLRQVFLDVAKGGFLRHGADGARPEHMRRTEHGDTVGVGLGLVLAGEVQVDIRHLVAAEAQEGFEGDVEAVLFKFAATFGAHRIGKVSAAVVALRHVQFGVFAVWIGAAVVGLEGVDLGDAGHIGHDGGTDRATGANQIAVFQRILH